MRWHSVGYYTISIPIFFSKTPEDYMEKCFANPEMSEEDKKSLHLILLKAAGGYGHFSNKNPCEIIANGDILFC